MEHRYGPNKREKISNEFRSHLSSQFSFFFLTSSGEDSTKKKV